MATTVNQNVTASRCSCPTVAHTPLPFSLRPVHLPKRDCFVRNTRPWRAPLSRRESHKLVVSAAASAGAKFVAPAIKGSTAGEVFLAGDQATAVVNAVRIFPPAVFAYFFLDSLHLHTLSFSTKFCNRALHAGTGSGALSARIAQELLQVGFKVTAGIYKLS